MKRNCLIVLLLLVLSGCDKKQFSNVNISGRTDIRQKSDPGATAYDIFLVAGQSNTHYGIGYNAAIDQADSVIFQMGRHLGQNRKIILASEPLHHWGYYTGAIGFALTFAKQYKNLSLQPGRKVLLVPCGYGGTSIQQWAKGTTLYNDAVARTLKAFHENPGSQIKGILWHQGEANVGSYNYTSLLDKFISDIRQDLGNPVMPFVLGGMVPYWAQLNTYTRAQQENIKNTPNRVSKTAYADPTVPFVISKPNNYVDAIHYDAAGQRELGLRYFNQYQTIR